MSGSDFVTQRRRRGDSPNSGDDCVDGVLCHLPVGGQLATGHRHDTVADTRTVWRRDRSAVRSETC